MRICGKVYLGLVLKSPRLESVDTNICVNRTDGAFTNQSPLSSTCPAAAE